MASTSNVEANSEKPKKRDRVRSFLRVSRKGKKGSSTSSGAENSPNLDQVKTAVDSANSTYLEMRPIKSSVLTALSHTATIAGLGSGVEEAFSSLVKHLSAFVSFVEKLGEVLPYAKMALTVFTAIPKAFIAQSKRDQAMKKLLDTMVDVYKLSRRYEDVEHLDDHRKNLLQKLSIQTVECAYYIREHALPRGLVKRTAKNVLFGSDIDERLTDYATVFVDLRRCLIERSALEVEIHVVSALFNIADQIELQDLTNVRGCGVNSSKACLPGTREQVLDELSSWVNGSDGPRIRFLLGLAGMGKSAVAHSLGSRFASLRRLGSFFAFDRNFQGDRHPESVLKTIARDLARWNPAFRRELAKAVREDGTLLHTDDITTQWNELIVKPAKRVMFLGPVLIVLDAFDESSSSDGRSRRMLLRRLTDGAEALPPNFRVLITSRPEDDIASASMSSAYTIAALHLEPSPQDVEVYIRHTLDPGDKLQDPPSEACSKLLVEKAAGVFQWAFTACRILLENPSGLSVEERFNERLGMLVHSDASSLDDLYSNTLDQIFPKANPIVISRFQSVMAHILCASRPLSMEELQIISSEINIEAKNNAPLVVLRMGAFLSGLDSSSSPIRPLHTSFRDFLLTESRSGRWYVDVLKGHSSICLALVMYLNRHLRFNIFNISSSYLRNSQIPQLKEQSASSPFFYAAHYLKDHVPPPSILPNHSLQAALWKLLCENFLYWLEVLSAYGTINTASSVLQKASAYFAGTDYQRNCDAYIQDAISFVRRFGRIIAHSIPHIYISALPFAPTSSFIRNSFRSTFPRQIVPDGIPNHWPQTPTIASAKSSVLSSAYLPDGWRVVSGSVDSTVRIWDAETGEAIGKPLNGHSGAVRSVACSPDGRQIVSGSVDSTVRIWDAETGDAIGKPLSGHSNTVSSVAYSPNSRQVISGSWDSTVRIWDAETGEAVGEPLSGHSAAVSSVAYSPNGRQVISGSWDSTVRIWDVETGETVGEPFSAHSTAVESVAYSPDGRRVVSGSIDSTIYIWDVGTGMVIGEPFDGHFAAISSAVYSPDGRRIVSGSYDSTVRIWDAETGKAIGEPLSGHSATVYSVAYSPDSQRIVSGSLDSTVRIWHLKTSKAIDKPLSGRSAAVISVAYSPDGRRIVSGSVDSTVHTWDAETGEAISKPLNGHSAAVDSVAYSPDGRKIASGSVDSTVRIWDAETGEAVGEPLNGHSANVSSVAYSPDGLRIVSGSWDSTIRIWDMETGKAAGELFNGHFNAVHSVAYSPDGRRIVSGLRDSTIRIWDAESGEAIGNPLSGHSAIVWCVAYSPDGRRIVSGSTDATVRTWDAETGEAIGEPFTGHSDVVLCVAYSPDGRCIVSGSVDSTVRIWDAETGEAVGEPFIGHSAGVSSVTYSPDGRWIVSGSYDSAIRFFSSNSAKQSESHPAGGPNWFIKNLTLMDKYGVPQSAGYSMRMDDGWVVDEDNNLILWIPEEYRSSLWWPKMHLLIGGRQPSLTIDFENAKIGPEWAHIAEAVAEE